MACIRTLYTVRFIFDKQLHIIVTAVSRRYKVKTVSVMEAKVVCCKCKKRKSVVQLKLTAVQFHELKRFWRLRFLRPVGVGSLFWNATPCNFVHRCTCFAGNCCLYILGVHVPVKPCYITWQFHCVVSREDCSFLTTDVRSSNLTYFGILSYDAVQSGRRDPLSSPPEWV